MFVTFDSVIVKLFQDNNPAALQGMHIMTNDACEVQKFCLSDIIIN